MKSEIWIPLAAYAAILVTFMSTVFFFLKGGNDQMKETMAARFDLAEQQRANMEQRLTLESAAMEQRLTHAIEINSRDLKAEIIELLKNKGS